MGEKEGRGIWAHLESREVWKSLLPEAEVEEKIRRWINENVVEIGAGSKAESGMEVRNADSRYRNAGCG